MADPTVNNVTVFPPRCDKLLDVLALGGWDRFHELGREFLQQVFTEERLQAKAAQWVSVLEPWIASDPTLDSVQWQVVAEEWRSVTLPSLVPSFEAFLSRGLQVEAPPEVIDVTPPAVIVTSDAGFAPAALNGFEFSATSASGAPDGVTTWADEATEVTVSLNTAAPIADGSDLAIDFTTGVPSEQPYVGVGYYGDEADVSAHEYLVLTMRAEPERLVRIALSSRTYDEAFGGVWAEFSAQVNVRETATQFVIPFADLAYPSWAKQVWTEGQGWTVSDDEAKALVLQRVNGVAVNPAIDTGGEDSGRLFLDDLYFF